MKKRRKRRPFTPLFDICAAKVPNYRQTKLSRQARTAARLMGATAARVMRQSLSVKPDQIHPVKAA
jgi:hypothetical protein